MTSPISAVGGISPISSVTGAASASAPTGAASATGVGGNFSSALSNGIDAMDKAQNNADNLAIQAATGQNIDPAAITVAMTQAQLMTQLASTVQSKAVNAFNTIMGMQA